MVGRCLGEAVCAKSPIHSSVFWRGAKREKQRCHDFTRQQDVKARAAPSSVWQANGDIRDSSVNTSVIIQLSNGMAGF